MINLDGGLKISESFQLDAARLPKGANFQLNMLFMQLGLFGTMIGTKNFWKDS